MVIIVKRPRARSPQSWRLGRTTSFVRRDLGSNEVTTTLVRVRTRHRDPFGFPGSGGRIARGHSGFRRRRRARSIERRESRSVRERGCGLSQAGEKEEMAGEPGEVLGGGQGKRSGAVHIRSEAGHRPERLGIRVYPERSHGKFKENEKEHESGKPSGIVGLHVRDVARWPATSCS